GLFDDIALTSCSGTVPAGTPKDIYLGIRFDPAGRFNGLREIEFSIAGLGQDVLIRSDWPGLCPSQGAPSAPADTSAASTGIGGMDVELCTCSSGSQALLRFTIIALYPLTDRVLQVKRKYPTSNPAWRTPVFFQCDDPTHTPT